MDGAEITRTTTATDDERGLGWAATGAKIWAGRQLAATWPGRRLARTTYVKMARREKNALARSVKKKFESGVHTLGLPSLNAKSLGVGLFLDFANEFGTLQTIPNIKFICKVPWRCSKEPIDLPAFSRST